MRLRRNALAAIGGIAMVYILGAVAIGVGAPAGNPVPGPSKSDPNTPPAKSAQPAAVITLIAPGKPPLRELRYNPKPGSEQLISMRMLQSVTQSAGPNQQRTMNVPEVTIKSKIKIVDVTADGDIHAEQTVTAILIKSDPNDPQNKTTTEMLDRAFEPIRNQTITLSLDKRGGVKEISEFKIGGSGKFSSEEMARNGTVAFPAEPVGVGAKWKAVATLTQGGITMTMTTTTEVISMEGDKLTVKTEVEGS
ncbi:hypothetical protein HY256_07310, partial [Candidatus Sumerlaeota bacterium]|nr:hypothetical protein [Candidatus Sumerlaeota bacterium]